jgi:hypothetical protein
VLQGALSDEDAKRAFYRCAHHIAPGIADLGYLISETVHTISKGGLLLPTRLFAVNAVRRVEGAQSTAGVCALDL